MIMGAKRSHRGVVKVKEACAPKRVVVAGAMCESAAMEVVCVRKTAVAIGSEGSRRTQSATRKKAFGS